MYTLRSMDGICLMFFIVMLIPLIRVTFQVRILYHLLGRGYQKNIMWIWPKGSSSLDVNNIFQTQNIIWEIRPYEDLVKKSTLLNESRSIYRSDFYLLLLASPGCIIRPELAPIFGGALLAIFRGRCFSADGPDFPRL